MMRIPAVFFLSLISICLSAQKEFKGGLIAGVVTSQISGDGLGGWDKFGFAAGAWIEVPLSDRMGFNMAMKYINKGSRTKVDSVSFQTFGYYLNYIDVPLLLTYSVHSKPDKAKVDLLLGPVAGILLNQKIVSNGFEVEVNPPFRSFEIGAEFAVRLRSEGGAFVQFGIGSSVIPTRPNPSQVNKLSYYESGNYNQTLQLLIGFRFGGKKSSVE
jgi:hypothetical protein